MILQISKELTKNNIVTKMTEYVDDVSSIHHARDFVMAELSNGKLISLGKDCAGDGIEGASEELGEYNITSAWLLNNEGKTLKKLF